MREPISRSFAATVAASGMPTAASTSTSAAGSPWSSLGHCHPAPLAAARAQLGRLWHASNLYRTEPAEQLAAALSDRFGGAQAFFCNSGAEAIEAA